MTQRHAVPLQTIAVTVPEPALEAYEAALGSACETVGFFRDHASGDWRVEGVKQVGVKELYDSKEFLYRLVRRLAGSK